MEHVFDGILLITEITVSTVIGSKEEKLQLEEIISSETVISGPVKRPSRTSKIFLEK